MSLCLSRKVGGNPGAQFDEIYKKSKEDELAQRCMEEKDCIATGDDSEKDLFTISQSRKVITEQTVSIVFPNQRRNHQETTTECR